MPNWGRGRFISFYLDGLQLRLSHVALANVAWCATSGNKYPESMLNTCFDLHTAKLLSALNPDLVLLSGSKTHNFAAQAHLAIPRAQIVPMLHHAHRKGRAAEVAELERVRNVIAQITRQLAADRGAAAAPTPVCPKRE
jgi:hypothetical protein